MKKLTLPLLFSIMCWVVQGQNQVKILAPNYVKENTIIPSIHPLPIKTSPASTHPDNGYYAAFKATKSQNIQVDEDGKIMFFIIDGYVFDRKGRTLGRINLDSDGKCGETVIVPSPQSCNNTFFLLTTYTTSGGVIGGYASFDKIKIEYDAYDDLIPGSGLSSELEQVAFPSTF